MVSWLPPSRPVGVVLISHGLHEHALRYYAIAHHLTARGIAVFACDHYAHGRYALTLTPTLTLTLTLSVLSVLALLALLAVLCCAV